MLRRRQLKFSVLDEARREVDVSETSEAIDACKLKLSWTHGLTDVSHLVTAVVVLEVTSHSAQLACERGEGRDSRGFVVVLQESETNHFGGNEIRKM